MIEGILLVSPGLIIPLVVLGVLIIIFVLLFIFGKKAQKKQAQQQATMLENKQYVTLLVIDKKKLKVMESGLPQQAIDQTPKYLRWQKLPIVKCKIGPQIMNLVADDKIFDDLPVKKELKAGVSGIYIMDYKELHGKKSVPDDKNPKKKKKRFARWVDKLQEKAGAKPIK